MKFILECEVSAKRNTQKILNRVIARAVRAIEKEKTVQMIDIRGIKVVDDEE